MSDAINGSAVTYHIVPRDRVQEHLDGVFAFIDDSRVKKSWESYRGYICQKLSPANDVVVMINGKEIAVSATLPGTIPGSLVFHDIATGKIAVFNRNEVRPNGHSPVVPFTGVAPYTTGNITGGWDSLQNTNATFVDGRPLNCASFKIPPRTANNG